jgi:hypothetical protein
VGNSSRKAKEVAYITSSEDAVTEVLKNIGGKPDLKDFKPKVIYEYDLTGLDKIILEKKDFNIKRIDYSSYKKSCNQKLRVYRYNFRYFCHRNKLYLIRLYHRLRINLRPNFNKICHERPCAGYMWT